MTWQFIQKLTNYVSWTYSILSFRSEMRGKAGQSLPPYLPPWDRGYTLFPRISAHLLGQNITQALPHSRISAPSPYLMLC